MVRAALLLSGVLIICTASARQQGPQQPTKSTKKTADPNQPPDPLDPTKDPMKDPALDISKPAPDELGADALPGGIQAPDYTGPAILSRGFALTRPAIAIDDKFVFYVGLNASYDSGLLGAYVLNGQNPTISTAGADLNWGINGKHYRSKDIFELNYSGHYYDYAANTRYNGQDHSLSVGYTREFNPRFTGGIRETAGLYSNTYSVLNSTSLSDTSLASATLVVAPNTESFSNRTYYTTTQGSVVWQKTARLSFSIAGSNFLVRRNSAQLADVNGFQASLDAAYRLSKRQTIGVYYTHSEFTFRKEFGSTNADSIGGDYTIAVNRNMDLSIRAGVTQLETQALGIVTPNPLVQAVLGITTGVEKQYLVGYAPDITVTLNRRLRTSSFGGTFTKGISPGNGLVLTSSRESESIFYNLPTFRKYATQFGGGRDKLTAYLNSTGEYSSYYARLSLSRPLMRNVSSIFNFDFRKYSFNTTTPGATEFRVSVGFRYSPGDGTAKFW